MEKDHRVPPTGREVERVAKQIAGGYVLAIAGLVVLFLGATVVEGAAPFFASLIAGPIAVVAGLAISRAGKKTASEWGRPRG